jgi:hypothetical protein
VSRAADLAALLEALPADTLRAALSALLPSRHPAAAAAGGSAGGKQGLLDALQVGVGGLRGRAQGVGRKSVPRAPRVMAAAVPALLPCPLTPDPAPPTRPPQSAAPAPRVVAAVRGLAGPMVRLSPALQRLFARLQRVYFLSEGQDLSA